MRDVVLTDTNGRPLGTAASPVIVAGGGGGGLTDVYQVARSDTGYVSGIQAKVGAGKVRLVAGRNTSNATRYLHVLDVAATPAGPYPAVVPHVVAPQMVPPNCEFDCELPGDVVFGLGLLVVASTTEFSLTPAVACLVLTILYK